MAITYGMSVKEFWEEDPDLFWAYRFSYIEGLKMQREQENAKAWLQGAYIYEAVSVALSNAFSKKHINYSEQPYALNGKNETKQKQNLKLQTQLINRVLQVQKLFGGDDSHGKQK